MLVILKMILFSVLILIYLTVGISSDNPCGNWKAYKEEKCIQIFDAAGLLDYDGAENFCKNQKESHLLSIDLEEKQKFVETFLKSNSVVDNVWIGLKYVNDTYQWADGTTSKYNNWGKGNLKSNVSHCVQLQTESFNFGLWSDESCSKKNLVICEKAQVWSMAQMQSIVTNLMKEEVPVGFIYVQLPNEDEPTKIWPATEWEDISKNYAGLFFRTEGGDAAPFKEVQEADSPRLVSMRILTTHDDAPEVYLDADNEYSEALSIDGALQHTGWELQAKVSKGEVRPRNMAIKIWKRTT